MQGVIYLGEFSREARRALEAKKPSEEYLRRCEKIADRNALLWWRKAEIDVDKAKVVVLFGERLRKYWTKCGYSQRWIDQQLQG
jgi:hypothetical protein